MIDGKTIIIDGCKPDTISKLLDELKASGTHVATQGVGIYVIEGHGVKSTATYKDGDLTVTVTSKPFYVSMERIEEGLDDAINSALGKGN